MKVKIKTGWTAFNFKTPPPVEKDSPDERAEKDRLIEEFMKKNGVKKLETRWAQFG